MTLTNSIEARKAGRPLEFQNFFDDTAPLFDGIQYLQILLVDALSQRMQLLQRRLRCCSLLEVRGCHRVVHAERHRRDFLATRATIQNASVIDITSTIASEALR